MAACGDDPVTVETVAGSYVASTLTVTESGSTQDFLAQGASLAITLSATGSTTGQLFVPGGDEDGSDLTADLAGTWTLSGSEVSFDQAADTFVRDMSFLAGDRQLVGEATFGGATIRVVLERQ